MGGSVKSTIEFRQAGGSDAQFWSGQNLCFKQAIIRVLMNSVMKIECFFPMMLCLPAKYKNNLEISNFVRNIFYINIISSLGPKHSKTTIVSILKLRVVIFSQQ